MKRVYVINKGGHDYSAAERYGDLYYCTDGPVDKNDIQQMYRELNHALTDSEQDDYILLTSLASLCSIACAIFAAKHGRLNLLVHTGSSYLAKTMVFDLEEQP